MLISSRLPLSLVYYYLNALIIASNSLLQILQLYLVGLILVDKKVIGLQRLVESSQDKTTLVALSKVLALTYTSLLKLNSYSIRAIINIALRVLKAFQYYSIYTKDDFFQIRAIRGLVIYKQDLINLQQKFIKPRKLQVSLTLVVLS